MLNQVCQVMHKNSSEAGMQKMETFAEDILKNMFEILAIFMVSNQLGLLKNNMSCMVASQYCLFKRMSYTKAADLQYLVLTMTIYTKIMVVVCVVQVNFTKKLVILWLLKKGFRALLTLGSQPCFLGEECPAALWGVKMPSFQGKNTVLLCKAHC